SDIPESEQLDISESGENNAILLAISTILQGRDDVAGLSEFLANISSDIREDGILDNPNYSTKLINNAKLLDLPTIRDNLENRYTELGMNITLPEFEYYLNTFINSTDYIFTSFIEYPDSTNYGLNILFPERDTIQAKNYYSMSADLPMGTSLKIVLRKKVGFVDITDFHWGVITSSPGPLNWDISLHHSDNPYSTYTVEGTGLTADLKISFQNRTDCRLDIEYYENESETPSNVKTLTIIGRH
ncbi:MAG: hypothetical protein HQ541_15990, partial [Mariniphaga sp.]|nr:hypothetical protein [Mariniphaga sp.]